MQSYSDLIHIILIVQFVLLNRVLNDFCHEIKPNYCNFIQRNMISFTYILI